MLLYDVLGLPQTASTREARRAYREKVFALHPDRNDGDGDSTLAFQRVAFAYEVIGDQRLRRIYDQRGLEAACRAAGVSLDRTMWPEAISPPVRRKRVVLMIRRRQQQQQQYRHRQPVRRPDPLHVAVTVTLEDVYQQRDILFSARVRRSAAAAVEKRFRIRFLHWDQVRATSIVVKNQGNQTEANGAIGDVHVHPKLVSHPTFEPWNRYDLLHKCPLTQEQQRRGFSLLLHLPDENATLVRISSDNARVSETRKQSDMPWAAGSVVMCPYGLCKRQKSPNAKRGEEGDYGSLYVVFTDDAR